jgi:hypothetical protein
MNLIKWSLQAKQQPRNPFLIVKGYEPAGANAQAYHMITYCKLMKRYNREHFTLPTLNSEEPNGRTKKSFRSSVTALFNATPTE